MNQNKYFLAQCIVYLTANDIILHFCNKHIRSHCTAVPLYKSNIYNVNHFSKNSAPIKYI